MPETQEQEMTGRKFGVEIEFGLTASGTMQRILTELRNAGLSNSTSIHGHMGHSGSEWVVKRDASVPNGGELVSPPLNFDNADDRNQVTRAVKALNDGGARTVTTAGIHVHVESGDLSAKQVAAVARLFVKFEDCIYRLASSGWETLRSGASTYCKPLSTTQAAKIARARNEDQLKKAYYGNGYAFATSHSHASRYCGINLHSHFYRGTIEFRVFNSSLNARRVQAYIGMCMAMVVDAKKGKIRSITKAYKLGQMRSGVVTESKALFAFLQILRYDGGLSLDDYRSLKHFWKDSKPQASTVGGW